ncbi:glycosyltransferase family 4 protein [Candidatus Berkelbacteria bacterium]|nr:glycosyltransferase family 4 protein [Candidatus Berkelbacteria bacterium]
MSRDSKKPIAVLQIIATAHGFGGGSRHVYDLATHLVPLDIHSTVLAPKSGENRLLTLLTAAKIPTMIQAMPSAFDKEATQRLPELVNQWSTSQPTHRQLIHIHGFRAGILARRALGNLARKLGIPIVYTEHLLTLDYRLPNPIRQQLQYWYLRQADKMTTKTIAVSEAVRTFLLTKKITTPDKIVVIPHGVALADPPADRTGISKRTGAYLIGMLGSLVPLKAHADVIHALPLINQNISNVMLHVIGDGPMRGKLEKLAHKLGVATQIVWHGHLAEPRPMVAGWDVFISASTSESFGLSIAEAMAEGVPVVATRVGAVPEIVTSATGRLVPVHNPHDLAKAIIDLLPRRELRQKMGEAAAQRIRNHFTIAQMVEKTADLYREMTQGRKNG